MTLTRRQVLAALPLTAAAWFSATGAARAAGTIDASAHPTLQAAVDAAPNGSIIVSSQPRTYGSVLLETRQGITLSGLTIAGTVQVNSSLDCSILGCTITAGGDGVAIFMVRPKSCTVANCTINAGGINGYSFVDCSIRDNVITNAPVNGIGVTGFADAPVQRTTYSGNRISDCGRIGIEETGDSTNCLDSQILNNTITQCASMGISATGLNPYVAGNVISEPGWAGIEVGGHAATVTGNTVSSVVFAGTAIMVNSTNAGVSGTASVTNNTIESVNAGVSLIGNDPAAPLRNVTVSGNRFHNCAEVSVSATPEHSAGGIAVQDNNFTFDVPSLPGKNRIAINTGADLYVGRNVLTYLPLSTGFSIDLPIHLVGNNVTMEQNSVDGGGRSLAVNLYPSTSVTPPATYSGWKYLGNRHFGGATIDKSGTVADVDADVL